MAAAGLQPHGNDGAGAADAPRLGADPAVRRAADPRRTAHCVVAMALQHSRHQVLLGIIAPMLLARPIAAAIGAGRFGEDGRRVARIALPATVAAALAIRLLAVVQAHDADRADRRRLCADFRPQCGPAGIEAKAGAQRLCVRRLSHLLKHRGGAHSSRRARGASMATR